MAVIRDRITVIPPDGETVVVDIKSGGVSLGTAHAERTTARTLTLPLSITERTSFFVPVDGTYTVSVKLNDVEIAGPGGTTVTASSFPTEVRARIDTAETSDIVGSGGSPPDTELYVWESGIQTFNNVIDSPSLATNDSSSVGAGVTYDNATKTFTVVTPGVYAISCNVQTDASGTGSGAFGVWITGLPAGKAPNNEAPLAAGEVRQCQANCTLRLDADDTFAVMIDGRLADAALLITYVEALVTQVAAT